jgi:hypothetical protein
MPPVAPGPMRRHQRRGDETEQDTDFFTFFHRCSIGLKSGEYDGNGSIVKRAACALKKSCMVWLV